MVEILIVTILHENLIAPVTGFAEAGNSINGNAGVNIFIPTGSPDKLIDLIKV